MTRNQLLYLTIFIEGYVVLASELLVIRQLIPHVGAGTETIAIIIAAVLMPLAVGYYKGGLFSAHLHAPYGYRKKIIQNLLSAFFVLALGLSLPVQALFFMVIEQLGVGNRLVQAAAFCGVFVVYPIFLLGQTIPLVSNFFSQQFMALITGKMLFFSTIGSFAGSVVSTLIFMAFLGVHNTVIITLGLLWLLLILLSRRVLSMNNLLGTALLLAVCWMNSPQMMDVFSIKSNNAYSEVVIRDGEIEGTREMLINNSLSTRYAEAPKHRFSYVQAVERRFIDTLPADKAMEILVVGAGGFTIGMDDVNPLHQFTFVDIDPSLKEVSEQYLLGRPIGANQRFVNEDARVFLRRAEKQYDLIILDVFSNKRDIPASLITVEFFREVKARLAENGVLAINAIFTDNFSDDFVQRYDNTLRAALGPVNRIPVNILSPWEQKAETNNILYVHYNHADTLPDATIYTDDKNPYFWDKGL